MHGVDREREGPLDLDRPLEVVVLAPTPRTALCRLLGTDRQITLSSPHTRDHVPGEILTVRGLKQWRYGGRPSLSGEILRHRLDVDALDLLPLRLLDEYPWNPLEEYWGEEGEPLPEWAIPIVARGPRPSFEMERVCPGEDPDDWDSDPIIRAIELKDGGDRRAGERALMELLALDLRCLDAHAHLGSFCFDRNPQRALQHYEVGVRIGEQALGRDFDGLLPWGRIDNRPFLRCLHGFGLCLWRIGRRGEALAVFDRMLWLNPTDNQGARFLLSEVADDVSWENRRFD